MSPRKQKGFLDQREEQKLENCLFVDSETVVVVVSFNAAVEATSAAAPNQ
ncbi:unnamed protein product [Camellia sinensis]